MDRPKTTLFSAFVIATLLAPAAFAQATAAHITVVSGNGQMFTSAPYKTVPFFYPMVVKVTDASGNPIAGKTVNWGLISSIGTLPSIDLTSVTDSNGIAYSRIYQGVQSGSGAQPFLQSVISATADLVSVNFTETQALIDGYTNNQLVFSQTSWGSNAPPTLTGFAGSTGTVPIQIHIDGRGTPVPNVNVRLLSGDPTTQPSAACATGAGADPGSVLTDASGNATCYPVFGPIAGNATVSALVAGLDPAQFNYSVTALPLTAPVAYDEYANIPIVVKAIAAGSIGVVSGNNQTLNPGASSTALVVKVTDSTGAVPVGNTTVAWTVSPAGMATLSQSQSTTNSSGQTQVTVTLSPTAVGQITVMAALGSNSSISTSFTVTTNVQIASVSKVSGDQQSAQVGQNFSAPLVVQVNGTNGQPVVGQPVSFSLTGGATLSATSVPSDATGHAQVTVTAGATAGTVTVTASIGSMTQTFTLTIIPPGPSLSSTSFFNAGGGNRLAALSPCSLVTVIAPGLAPSLQGLVFNTNSFGPWATTLASDTVTVNSVAAPIYSVSNMSNVQQLTFQVPCETAPASSVPITINVSGGTASVNVPVQAATPGIFETVMSDGTRRAVVIRPDGSFVSLQNPARRGEVVRVFVTGMGLAVPAVSTGTLPLAGSDSLIDPTTVIVGVNNSGTRVVTVRLSPNLIGVSEVAFQVPSDAPTGNDIVLSVAINAPGDSTTRFSNGSKLPIQ